MRHLKTQYNKPKDKDGNLIEVLNPRDGYLMTDLLDNCPWWASYNTRGECPVVKVSPSGMVATQYRNTPDRWRVLQQQWSYQDGDKPNKEELLKMSKEKVVNLYLRQQKYLEVWFADNPGYPTKSNPHLVHQLVGESFCDYHTDCVEWDPLYDYYKLKTRLQLDHLDKDKSNNYYRNLNWVTAELNKRMVAWSIKQKEQYFQSVTSVDSSLIKIQ